MSMPPYDLWLHGAGELRKWLLGAGAGCRGSRYAPVEANGSPAFAQWKVSESGAGHDAWAIHVLRLSDGRIRGIDFFVDENLFPLFGLPVRLEP
jgi:RNA polymerase sigma-70 factor, ECF subfamily